MNAVTNKAEGKVVAQSEWVTARKELLRKEKELTHLRDEISRQRRALPWEKVEKNYVFDGPRGKESLSDLFGERSQLIVYHFMFGPGWKEGCPSCSFLADGFDGAAVHLAHRDVTFLGFRGRPYLRSKHSRSGWYGNSSGCRRSEMISTTTITCRLGRKSRRRGRCTTTTTSWSFRRRKRPARACSIRTKRKIFHTYSSFGRGLDPMITTYNWLDLTPKGRMKMG